MSEAFLPRLLVIDDVLGRRIANGTNEERANLCAHFRLHDVTDESHAAPISGHRPIADAVFIRGQKPEDAKIGDVVKNDLDGIIRVVRSGFPVGSPRAWNLVLLDLSFYTGLVTPVSDAKLKGMPEGDDGEKKPPGYFGLSVLEWLHENVPDLPVLMLSSRSRAEVALQFAKGGALGFIESDAENGSQVLQGAIDRHALVPDPSGTIIGRSIAILKVLRAARRSASNNQNILIRGESGTGKELIAEYVNLLRRPSNEERPFCIVNSGSLTGDLYYSELFGHSKGAFTDARTKRIGMIEQANGGDLFLDEIANMPAAVQNGLLRVLEEGIITPLGGQADDAKKVQVRFITATHANLELMIAEGKFREDLYERLHRGGILFVSPLRERGDDIQLLLEHFTRNSEKELQARERVITAEAVEKCRKYSWPRNIRQLQNCIYQAVSAYPDLEYLLAQHIVLPPPGPEVASYNTRTGTPSPDLASVIAVLQDFDFDTLSDDELHGLLPRIETSCGVFLAHCLRVGLARHRRPGDRVFIQPALQFVTGNESLSTTAAYDIIKRIARRVGSGAEFERDELLAQALDKSRAARSSAKTTTGSANSGESDDE